MRPKDRVAGSDGEPFRFLQRDKTRRGVSESAQDREPVEEPAALPGGCPVFFHECERHCIAIRRRQPYKRSLCPLPCYYQPRCCPCITRVLKVIGHGVRVRLREPCQGFGN